MSKEPLQKNQSRALINEAWKNPFVLGLKKHIESEGKLFPHFLCYRSQEELGKPCTFKAHVDGKYAFKKKLECQCQVQALLALHFQSKHLTGDRLQKLLDNLKQDEQ